MIKAIKKINGWSVGEVREYLARHDIRPSVYRLKIFHYLINEKKHPTAEEIYRHLKKEIPSVSPATVYNTLNLFAERRIVQLINIERNEARYDATLFWHGHFKCINCGKIFDFHIERLKLTGPKGFEIEKKNLNLEGKCPQCRGK